MLRSLASTLFVLSAAVLTAAAPDDLFRSIRDNDLVAIKLRVADGEVNKADARGTTALHYAAAFGSVESVRILLEAGAEVNAKNGIDATPLILGASSPEKVRLLMAKGADPRSRTKAGRTALIIAAGRAGGAASVRALLDAGADATGADELGVTPLGAAAMYGDLETVRLLLARGAKPVADKAGFPPVSGAVASGDVQRVRLLLAKGDNVNAANSFGGAVKHGPIALTQLTPLILAAPHGSVDMVRVLLEAGAQVNARDGRGMTSLMAAVSSENQDPEVIKALIGAGADVNAKDGSGESVLDWARKFGNPVTLKLLKAAGAQGSTPAAETAGTRTSLPVRDAVNKAVELLHRSSTQFFKESGCVSCHHQSLTARVDRMLDRSGIPVSEDARQEQTRARTILRPLEPALLQFIEPGGEVDTVATTLVGFADAGIPASSLTDAAVNYIAGKQSANGSWTFDGVSRVPMEDSTITRTALAVKALRSYTWPARRDEFEAAVAKARAWLLSAEPRTSYERADLLLGLYWAGASAADVGRAAAKLRREQHPNGGWSQNRYLAPDAYATGLALHALHETGQLRVSDAAYGRGVDFLLKNQHDDGSWYVRSRAPKFQPYFESGFPHGHDQWVSAAATSYAVMALAPAVSAPVSAARR